MTVSHFSAFAYDNFIYSLYPSLCRSQRKVGQRIFLFIFFLFAISSSLSLSLSVVMKFIDCDKLYTALLFIVCIPALMSLFRKKKLHLSLGVFHRYIGIYIPKVRTSIHQRLSPRFVQKKSIGPIYSHKFLRDKRRLYIYVSASLCFIYTHV